MDTAERVTPTRAPDADVTAPADDLESRVSLARQGELIAAALEGGALDTIEPLAPAAEPLAHDSPAVAREVDRVLSESVHGAEPVAVPAEPTPDPVTAGMGESPVTEGDIAALAMASPDLPGSDLSSSDLSDPDSPGSNAPGSELTASDGGAAPSEGQVEPPSVPLIEVWRPHRQNAHARRPPERTDRNRGPRRAHPGAHDRGRNVPGTNAPGTSAPALAASGGDAEPAAAGAADARSPRSDARGDRNRGGRDFKRGPGDGGRPNGGRDRPRGERREGGAPGGERGGAPGGGFGGRRDERRAPSFQTTEKPKPRDRAPDPNSPFAKLAALKAQLEKDGK